MKLFAEIVNGLVKTKQLYRLTLKGIGQDTFSIKNKSNNYFEMSTSTAPSSTVNYHAIRPQNSLR